MKCDKCGVGSTALAGHAGAMLCAKCAPELHGNVEAAARSLENSLDLNGHTSEGIRRAVAEALDVADKARWWPIETAPRDGSYVLIGWFDLVGQKSMHVAFWHSTRNAWCQSHRAFTDDLNWQPTHWQPLPPPPNDVLGVSRLPSDPATCR